MKEWIRQFDEAAVALFRRHGHRLHRISLGVLFVWFGLLKPLGLKTTTSLLAHTIYWGEPEVVVQALGWWEVAIGICLIWRPLVRLGLLLLIIRLPGILLAFALKADVCFVQFPFAPTPEGQYLIKDLTIFFAALAIAGSVRQQNTPDQFH